MPPSRFSIRTHDRSLSHDRSQHADNQSVEIELKNNKARVHADFQTQSALLAKCEELQEALEEAWRGKQDLMKLRKNDQARVNEDTQVKSALFDKYQAERDALQEALQEALLDNHELERRLCHLDGLRQEHPTMQEALQEALREKQELEQRLCHLDGLYQERAVQVCCTSFASFLS